MSRAKPVTIAGKHYPKQKDAIDYFKKQKQELLPAGPITSGELFEALKDVYTRYCDNSPGYELKGRVITAFSVDYETRKFGDQWMTNACYKAHFSNAEIRPFSIGEAVKSLSLESPL